jgi:ribonuclease Z
MILLGVGTAVPDQDRENTHMVWESPDGLLLVDAGGSTYQRLLRAGLDPFRLRAIVLTHSHADHINGLPALLFALKLAGFSQALTIYGNEPTLALVQRVLAAFELESYQADARWETVEAGQEIPLWTPSFRLRTAPTVHSRPGLALRFEDSASGRALAYSADTEPCDAVRELARGAAVLIHEATTPEPFAGHTSPRQAGVVAAGAGVAQLVLVHFSPRWTISAAQAIEEVRAGGFRGEAEIGREFGAYAL